MILSRTLPIIHVIIILESNVQKTSLAVGLRFKQKQQNLYIFWKIQKKRVNQSRKVSSEKSATKRGRTIQWYKNIWTLEFQSDPTQQYLEIHSSWSVLFITDKLVFSMHTAMQAMVTGAHVIENQIRPLRAKSSYIPRVSLNPF